MLHYQKNLGTHELIELLLMFYINSIRPRGTYICMYVHVLMTGVTTLRVNAKNLINKLYRVLHHHKFILIITYPSALAECSTVSPRRDYCKSAAASL